MVVKRSMQLTTKILTDKGMETLHQVVHNVLTDEEMGGCRVKA